MALPGRVDPVVMPLQASGVPSACVERGCVFADEPGVVDVVVRNLRVAPGHRLRRELRPCLHDPAFRSVLWQMERILAFRQRPRFGPPKYISTRVLHAAEVVVGMGPEI